MDSRSQRQCVDGSSRYYQVEPEELEYSCPEVRLMPIDEQRLGLNKSLHALFIQNTLLVLHFARASSTAPTVPYYSLVILQEPRAFKEE